MFFFKHVHKNCLNVLIELWFNPGLLWAPSVKPGHTVSNVCVNIIDAAQYLHFLYSINILRWSMLLHLLHLSSVHPPHVLYPKPLYTAVCEVASCCFSASVGFGQSVFVVCPVYFHLISFCTLFPLSSSWAQTAQRAQSRYSSRIHLSRICAPAAPALSSPLSH